MPGLRRLAAAGMRKRLEEAWRNRAPDLPLAEVPDGKDETGNIEVRRWGKAHPELLKAAAAGDLPFAPGIAMRTSSSRTRVFRLRFRIARRGAAIFAGERAPVATW